MINFDVLVNKMRFLIVKTLRPLLTSVKLINLMV